VNSSRSWGILSHMHGESNGNRVFVYRTLRRGFPLHRHLASMKPRYRGRGTVKARLCDLGEYPGAVKSSLPGDKIIHELYEINEPVSQLRELDAFEEFDPAIPAERLFVRRSAIVQLKDAVQSRAWIDYVNKKPCRARAIRGGHYTMVRSSSVRTNARRA
jgi:gamma-glutamylcyclotransferase (GGCT)/AIG2-like uncharacterized protein YtfP